MKQDNALAYRYSRDYGRLYTLICEGFIAAAFVDYRIRGSQWVSRDVCSVRTVHKSPTHPFAVYIGVRGTTYASISEFDDTQGMDRETFFAKVCESINLEWIDPSSHEVEVSDDAGTMETLVCDGADNALLGRLVNRKRLLGKHEAGHPVTVERVLAALDASGPSEAGDVIQSLLWKQVTADHLAASLSDMLSERDKYAPLSSGDDESEVEA